MKGKNKNPFYKNRYEIIYKLINSVLAGALVFLGAMSDGGVTKQTFLTAGLVSSITIITQFKNYFDSESGEYATRRKVHLFNFINL